MEAVDRVNLEKIESFFNTDTYRECLEGGATFNSRLSQDRRSRSHFHDPQTGVAQRPCSLYVKAKQRMPGMSHGQLYSFPAKRWRKSKRQYLTNQMTDFRAALHLQQVNIVGHGGSAIASSVAPVNTINSGAMSGGFLVLQQDENSNSNASFLLDKGLTGDGSLLEAAVDTNSRDTNNNSKDEMVRDWIYDDLDNDFDSEPKSPDDEYDYDPRYGTKKKKRAPKKETKAKKNASSFGFDFGSGSGTPKRGRAKAGEGTPKKTPAGEGGERRTRRKGAGTNKNHKNYVEPPSFETAAAGFDDQLGAYGGGWM